jgi:hypothetical protein
MKEIVNVRNDISVNTIYEMASEVPEPTTPVLPRSVLLGGSYLRSGSTQRGTGTSTDTGIMALARPNRSENSGEDQ